MTLDHPRYATALAILAVVAAGACIGVTGWQLLVPGPFE